MREVEPGRWYPEKTNRRGSSVTKGVQILNHSSGWYVQQRLTRWPVQPDKHIEKDREAAELRIPCSSRAELQLLIATERRNLKSLALKSATMQGVEETLNKVVEMGLYAADTGVKHLFFRFIEMALTDMVHCGLKNKLIQSSFDCWKQSDVLINKLADEVSKHQNP